MNTPKDEITELTEELTKLKTYHDGWDGFSHEEDVQGALDLVEDYFSDSNVVIRRYGEEPGGFDGSAFRDYTPSVYENPKPSMVISFEDTKEPDYMLHGHLDVVHPQEDNHVAEKRDISGEENRKKAHFDPEIEGDLMYGRGTGDMKLGVATLMKLMKDLDEEQPSAALMLVTDEELGGFRGAGYLFQDVGYEPEMTISAEPTNQETGFTIAYRQKGNFQLGITAEGQGGHGSRPWEGENANDKLLEWFDVYRELQDRFPEYDSEDNWVTTINLGILDGGTKRTSIADKANAEVGIRFTQDYTPEEIMGDIAEIEDVNPEGNTAEEIADSINSQVEGYSYTVINNAPMQKNRKDNEDIQRLAETAEEVTGEEISLIKEEGASDARFPTFNGKTGVTFGPRGKNIHGEEEFADLASIEPYYKTLRKFITS